MVELSNEQKAVVLLSRLTFSRQDEDEINQIFNKGNFNWYEFSKYAIYHRTLSLDLRNLLLLNKSCVAGIPNYFLSIYRSFYKGTEFINSKYERMLQQILLDAQKKDIKLIPVKGVYLLHDLYRGYGIRFSGDMDILIQKKDLREIDSILVKNGFSQKKYDYGTDSHIDLSRKEEMKWKLHMSNIYPYTQKSNSDLFPVFKIDLRFALDDRLDESPVCEMIEYHSQHGKLPSHYYLLHLCTHFYNEAKYTAGILYGKDLNLIKMCDIREYVLAHREENVLPEVIELAKRFSCEKAIYYTMHILSQVYHDGYEQEVMDLLDIEDTTFLNTFGDSTLTDTQTFKKGFWERFFACGNFDELTETPKLIQ